MKSKVLGTHGLMKQFPGERTAERLAEKEARLELDKLEAYLAHVWPERRGAVVDVTIQLLQEYKGQYMRE